MSQPEAVARVFRAAALPPSSFISRLTIRGVLLAAHPDDETIGASVLLTRLQGWHVIFLTDGAPMDRSLRSPDINGSRQDYAAARAMEARKALAIAGIAPRDVTFLHGIDQETVHSIPTLAARLFCALSELRPQVVLTQPYEGGHPDHDTAALIARICTQRFQRERADSPSLLEMTSYHAEGEHRVSGEFLESGPAVDHLPECSSISTVRFTEEDLSRKARMMGCHASQWRVLNDFPLEPERIRIAPDYRFEKPPHHGRLWYEQMGWAMTGAEWRRCAAAAMAEEGAVRC
jgi:N-acetylglucosamine malate deacetylase 2